MDGYLTGRRRSIFCYGSWKSTLGCGHGQPVGGIVFHDATNARHAKKALDNGVHGFICVNNRAGGHAGDLTPQALYDEISPLGMPTICAGGVGDRHAFHEALKIGYLGVQMGTRFIASKESAAHDDYKNAIVAAKAADICYD